jgi:chemotaxis response regulator CheB
MRPTGAIQPSDLNSRWAQGDRGPAPGALERRPHVHRHAAAAVLERDNACDIVGASAGGVEALMRFASAVPADFSVPILVVLHIPATDPSVLPPLYCIRESGGSTVAG